MTRERDCGLRVIREWRLHDRENLLEADRQEKGERILGKETMVGKKNCSFLAIWC
jgi:hypothetical protein